MRLAAVLLAALTLAGAADARERVTFPSLDGRTTLVGHLFRPPGEGARPAVVMMHGCTGLGPEGRPTPLLAAWARRLTEQGYVALVVDSAGPRGFGPTCNAGPDRVMTFRDRPKDTYGALVYLQGRPDVRPDRIALLGWSQGGAMTLLAIAEGSAARPAALPGPDFRAAVAFYPGACSERLHARPEGWRTAIPLLILQGEADNWTPAAPCERFAAGAARHGSPVAFHLYPGAHHVFDAPGGALRDLPAFRLADGTVPTAGTDPAARADALQRVPAFLARHFGE